MLAVNNLVLHIVPVGHSIVDSLAGVDDLAALNSRLPVSGTSVREQLKAHTGVHGVLDLSALLGTQAQAAARDVGWSAAAEWTSVALFENREAPYFRRSLLLIASDTDEGLRAATFVAARWHEEGAVRYADDPGQLPSRMREGDVWIARIPQLRLGIGDPDSTTWFGLGAVGRAIQTTCTQPPLGCRIDAVLHLTGGYKALIPYLLVMAEGINSVFHDHDRVSAQAPPQVRAVATHRSTSNANQTVLDVPVRWLAAKSLEKVVRLKAAADDTGAVHESFDDLLGQFCEDSANGDRLTPAGMIMVGVV
jgi:hypothetical protein